MAIGVYCELSSYFQTHCLLSPWWPPFSLIHASNLILQLLKSSSRKFVVEATILFLDKILEIFYWMQIHKDACIKHPRNAHLVILAEKYIVMFI